MEKTLDDMENIAVNSPELRRTDSRAAGIATAAGFSSGDALLRTARTTHFSGAHQSSRPSYALLLPMPA